MMSKIPHELRLTRQWVNWKEIHRDGRPTKIPVQPSGIPASSTDTKTWSNFDAVASAASKFSGCGFVFTDSDCYVGVDLDGCRDVKTGKLEDWAKEVVDMLGTYTEVSPSGTGVKCFGSAGERWPHKNKIELPFAPICKKNPGIEIYDSGRYFAVTGQRLKGCEDVMPIDECFEWLADKFNMRQEIVVVDGTGVSHESPVIERASKYLAKMEGSVSGQGGHSKCFAAACVLVMGFGLDESEALHLLLHEFNAKCDPPWTEKELSHKVRSAAKQPGARNYLRDVEPASWSKVRMPPNYREHSVDKPDESSEPEKPGIRKTTLRRAAGKYLSELGTGQQQLIQTGIPNLDWALGGGVAEGEMMIIAARPSHGKSAVALQMAHSMSQNGLPVALVSEEMSAMALGKRAIQFASETPEQRWADEIDTVAGQVDLHFASRADIHILESCGSVDRAIEEVEKCVNEDGVKVAMIDYAQLLSAKGKDRYERITNVSQQLRMLASRMQILVVVLAQLNRSIENRAKFTPMMSDIKETGQLEQDADVILFGVWPHRINSEAPKSEYQFFVCKNRNRAIIEPAFECEFNPARQMLIKQKPANYVEAFDAF